MATFSPISEGDNHCQIPEISDVDIEKWTGNNVHLKNTTFQEFVWQDITVTVKDRKTKQPRSILRSVDGIVKAGRQ